MLWHMQKYVFLSFFVFLFSFFFFLFFFSFFFFAIRLFSSVKCNCDAIKQNESEVKNFCFYFLAFSIMILFKL